jgi:hypothetical protein
MLCHAGSVLFMEETEDDLSQVEQSFLSSSAQGIRDLQKWNEQSFIGSAVKPASPILF